eukprot:tig00000042_g15607.t1
MSGRQPPAVNRPAIPMLNKRLSLGQIGTSNSREGIQPPLTTSSGGVLHPRGVYSSRSTGRVAGAGSGSMRGSQIKDLDLLVQFKLKEAELANAIIPACAPFRCLPPNRDETARPRSPRTASVGLVPADDGQGFQAWLGDMSAKLEARKARSAAPPPAT